MNYAAQSFLKETATNGRPSYNDQGQMTASGVVDFLNNGIANITNKNRVARKTLLNQCLERLKTLQRDSLKNEEKFYEKLGVKNLEELQSKIKVTNACGLSNLSAEALNRLPLIKQTAAATSPKALEQAIREEIRANLTSDEGVQLMEQYIGELVEYIEKQNKKLTTSTKHIMLKFKEGVLADSNKKAQILAKFGLTIDENGHLGGTVTDITVNGKAPITEDNWILTRNSYPYFPWGDDKTRLLNIESDEIAKKVWTQFKNTISSCVSDSKVSSIIRTQMDKMGVAAFATAATGAAGIKGILGELYTMTLFAYLGMDDMEYVGDTLVDGHKIGVDTVVKGLGIQVKNYTPYQGGSDSASHGINMGRTLKLGTFLERIMDGGVSQRDAEAIGLFYATTAYHLQATPLYASILARYAPIEERLKNLYATQVDQFMPLHEISWIDSESKTISATNIFYLIGAGEIVPVSLILGIYIKFIEDLERGITNPRTFTVNLVGGYSGQTYLDYWTAVTGEPQQPYEFQGYDNIVSGLSVKLNINLNIDYTLEQVLTKVAKE